MASICVAVFAILVIVVNAETAFKELQKHNELETKGEKVDELLYKIEKHCDAINTGPAGGRSRRSALGVENLRSVLEEDVGCAEDVDPNPTQAPTQLPIDGPCTSPLTVNLTGAWRKDSLGSNIKPIGGVYYACDRTLQTAQHWFRFTGDAGVQLADHCRPSYSCGGHGSFWSNAPMPTTVGEIRAVPIYGSWNGNCNWYTWPTRYPMYVQRCSERAGDFVYKVQGTGSCYWTFCGMDLAPSGAF